jgi:hypothetical protein
MEDDDARKRILARRSTFVAAALTAMVCEPGCAPQPCLSQPQPCLSVEPHYADDAGTDGEPQQPLEPEGEYAKPPPGEVATETFALVVTFISIGQGTDRKSETDLETLVEALKKRTRTDLRVTRADWGKEGEEDWCFALSELSPSDRAKFIGDVKRVLGGKRLVQIAENAPCRQSKNH